MRAEFLIRRDEQFEPSFFSRGKQRSVLQAGPFLDPRGNHG
jgi:hypothetical protein